jgi:hypothetical protein
MRMHVTQDECAKFWSENLKVRRHEYAWDNDNTITVKKGGVQA